MLVILGILILLLGGYVIFNEEKYMSLTIPAIIILICMATYLEKQIRKERTNQ